MKKLIIVVMTLVATTTMAAVFERYLSPERPADRAILAYLELDNTGKATSRDLAELGVLLLDKGFPVDAEHYLRKAVDMDDSNFEASYRLGLVLQRTGQYRSAIRAYRAVVKQRPGHAYARFMLAMSEERAGRRRAAIHDYAKAYHFAPELALAETNPLVYDSDLQDAALITYYRDVASASTLKVTAIDPAAVQRMMLARPSAAPPAATPPPPAPAPPPVMPTSQPKPATARPAPAPVMPPSAAGSRGGASAPVTMLAPAPVANPVPSPSQPATTAPGATLPVIRNVSGTS
jgi:Flp pilus assembly protein TadD